MQTSKKRSRSLFKPFGRKWNQIWSLWQKKRPIMERSSKLLSENFGLWSMKLKQSKPLQGILMAIRLRQKEKMEQIKAKYWDGIKDLEPLKAPRPPKPKDEPKPAEEKKAEAAPAEPAPAAPAAAPEVTASA